MADDDSEKPTPGDNPFAKYVTVQRHGDSVVITENPVAWGHDKNKEMFYTTVWAFPRSWIVHPDKTISMRFGNVVDDTGRFGILPDKAGDFGDKTYGVKGISSEASKLLVEHLDPDAYALLQAFPDTSAQAMTYNLAVLEPRLVALWRKNPEEARALIAHIRTLTVGSLEKVTYGEFDDLLPPPNWLAQVRSLFSAFDTLDHPPIKINSETENQDVSQFVLVEHHGDVVVVKEDLDGWVRANPDTVSKSERSAYPRIWTINPNKTVTLRVGHLFDDAGRFGILPGRAAYFGKSQRGYGPLAEAALDEVRRHLDPNALEVASAFQTMFLQAAAYNLAVMEPKLLKLWRAARPLAVTTVSNILDKAHREGLCEVSDNGVADHLLLPDYRKFIRKRLAHLGDGSLEQLVASLYEVNNPSNLPALKYWIKNVPPAVMTVENEAAKDVVKAIAHLPSNGLELLKRLDSEKHWRTFHTLLEMVPELATKFATNPDAGINAFGRYFTPGHLTTFASPAEARKSVINEVVAFLKHSGQADEVGGRGFASTLDAANKWHRALREQQKHPRVSKNAEFAPSPLDGFEFPITSENGELQGSLVLIQLHSRKELKAEGNAHSHCVGTDSTYAASVHNGESVIFSVQDTDGHNIATAQFDQDYKLLRCLANKNKLVPKIVSDAVAIAPRLAGVQGPYQSYKDWVKSQPRPHRFLRRGNAPVIASTPAQIEAPHREAVAV